MAIHWWVSAVALATGLGAGFLAGWVVRGSTTPTQAEAARVPVPATAVLEAGAQLSQETAAKLAVGQMSDASPSGMCKWDGVLQQAETAWAFLVLSDIDKKCMVQMMDADLAKITGCADRNSVSKECMRVIVDAKPPARFVLPPQADGFYFPCGTFEFHQIESVATNGNTAQLSYSRTFTLDDALVSKIGSCKLTKPESGRAVRQRKAQRNDAGEWSIVR